jgi:cell division protein FtsQ
VISTLLRRPDAEDDADVSRSRRRFVRRRWLRRWLAWRYVVASVLLVALVVGSIWLVWFSSVLTVKQVDVQGESLLSQQQILNAADVPLGGHLAQLDLASIRSRVGALAPVRRVDVSRHWPDGVLIKVVERTPVAVVQLGGLYHAMDSDGVLFRTYPRPPAGLPTVVSSANTGSTALAEAATVIASLPSGLASRVDHIAVQGPDEISLVMIHGATVIWGSADQSDLKAQVLAALLPHPAKTYDVSVPGQPVTSTR